jgi:hypothetical protein
MIFVQIAAYRDPELLPTIQDCLAKAKYPNDLRFGICWQKDDADCSLNGLEDNPRFTIEKIPWQESKGLCWARAKIQRMYEGETYTLQIDSHHRFEEHWDEKMIHFLELTGSPRPIVTTYAGVYDPATNERKSKDPFRMVADRFTPSGTILFRPHLIKGWQDLKTPVRARFVSGHFFFTLGRHCGDYAYDPNLYFAGDEISLSIRSFTLGYDLFHPHRVVIWHEYTRQGRIKHWDDHIVANKHLVELAWHERDRISKRRLRKMLREEDNEEDVTGYDLGMARSHRDYELYAGIDFARRRLHRDAVEGKEPPCSHANTPEWESCFVREYKLKWKWNIADLEKCEDYKFIYFGVEDNCGKVLYRYDASSESPEALLQKDRKKVRFTAATQPAKLVIWPVSHSRGWLKKVVYPL